MEFHSDGLPITHAGLTTACTTFGTEPADLWTVLAIETGGFGFLPDRRPKVRFERHIFHRITKGRFDGGYPAISSATPGAYAGGSAEFARLELALSLNHDGALQSASWGLGQVLGLNCERAGFATVDGFVAGMILDEDAQLLATATFIANTGLGAALQRHDWTAFGAGYNGPASRLTDYAARLAAANARFRAALPDLRLRTAQVALCYLGIDPGPIDGVRGPRTHSALQRFQALHGLPADGTLDDRTKVRLIAAAFPGASIT